MVGDARTTRRFSMLAKYVVRGRRSEWSEATP
jgi:hypothetical protein